jgi:uncharacterized protein (DUF433 family)
MTDRITINPEVQHGKPVIQGTRIPVARVLGGLAGGMTQQQVIDEYGISEDDLRAVMEYAAQLAEQEQYYPLPQRRSA